MTSYLLFLYTVTIPILFICIYMTLQCRYFSTSSRWSNIYWKHAEKMTKVTCKFFKNAQIPNSHMYIFNVSIISITILQSLENVRSLKVWELITQSWYPIWWHPSTYSLACLPGIHHTISQMHVGNLNKNLNLHNLGTFEFWCYHYEYNWWSSSYHIIWDEDSKDVSLSL
jgi:hypothetical protein